MKTYRSADGTVWNVDVELPSHSSALIVFHHPAPTSRLDRYGWYLARGPHVNDPRSRLDRAAVLQSLDDRQLAALFRRSAPVQQQHEAYIVS
jgi:hypothetical protein